MEKKVYVIIVKESEKLTNNYEAFDTFEKAVKRIKSASKKVHYELRETDMKNEFGLYSDTGDFVHTLQIVDLWVH